ncbi:MAG: hypothetical protein DRP09_16385 [Candidatus Thorarchaeota archaeon]|nr:MAG: hypothetical protein DRP09_16385 [Candidatus Thorarchaeota archaeon]
MQSVIENAQAKCNEANKLLEVHYDRLLDIAVNNVYTAIKRDNIPKLLERMHLLETRYRTVRDRR